jgi:hypothetical protein
VKQGSTTNQRIYIGSKIEFKIELVKAYTRKRGTFLLDNSQICTDIQQLKEADLYIIMAFLTMQ